MNPCIQLKRIVVGLILLAVAQFASAQSFPRLTPLPPKKDSTILRATPAFATNSPWQLLTHQPPVLDPTDCGPGNPILLTDGTVMLADNGCQDWWKLTPDEFGSYVNGTWTQLASLPDDYSPLYHASAVLPDGRVIIEGGEYNFLTSTLERTVAVAAMRPSTTRTPDFGRRDRTFRTLSASPMGPRHWSQTARF